MCSVIKSCLTLCDPMGPWDFPGKNTGMGCRFLLQGSFLTQGSNPWRLHCQAGSTPLSHQGSPCNKQNRPAITWCYFRHWVIQRLWLLSSVCCLSLFFSMLSLWDENTAAMSWDSSVWNLRWRTTKFGHRSSPKLRNQLTLAQERPWPRGT